MAMVRKISCKTLLTLENAIRSFQLGYRTKINKEVPLLERFVNKVAELCKDKSEVPTKQMLERLETVQKFGFKAYEIVEYPQVLKMSEKELEGRLKTLTEKCTRRAKVLLMAKHLRLPVTKRNAMLFNQRWARSTVDGVSAIEVLRHSLKCSEEKMIDILTRNPRLRTIRNNLDIFEKIDVLFKYGAKAENLWAFTSLLKNVKLEIIKARAKKLYELGYNNPLPIGHIGRTEDVYEKIIEKLQKNATSSEETKNSLKVLEQIPFVKPNMKHVHKGKVDYLFSQGYSAEEIVDNVNVFCDSLDKIRNSVETMNSHYLEKVPLSRCSRNCHGKPDPPLHQRLVFKPLKVLGGHLMPEVKRKFADHAKGIPPGIFKKFFPKNVTFLMDKGFSGEELLGLPIVLCHEAQVLEEWWEKLWSDEKFRKVHSDDKLSALNVLQYSLEKHNNFRHAFPGVENDGSEPEVVEFQMDEEEDEVAKQYPFNYGQIFVSMSQ